MLNSVITYEQQAAMETIMSVNEDDGYAFMAPRYLIIPDHVRAEHPQWNEFTSFLLLIGAPDPLMEDCDECEHAPHVVYTTIRSDGMTTEPVTSGTFLEALIVPVGARWEDANAVMPEMWPTPNVPDTIPGM